MRVKALSSDNSLKIKKVCELFKATYQDSFFIGDVYCEEFWAKNIGTKFTSLVLESDSGKLFGHIALKRDPANSNYLELILPAVLPSFEEETCAELMQAIELNAKNQNAKLLFCNIPISFNPNFISLLSIKHNYTATCITPCLTSNFCLTFIKKISDRDTTPTDHIFLPTRHLNFIKQIGLCDNLINCKKREFDYFSNSKAAEEKAIEFYKPACLGQTKIYIDCELLALAGSKLALDEKDLVNPCFYISLRSKKALETCKELEEYGFKFCGIQPQLKNNHYAVYSYFYETIPSLAIAVKPELNNLIDYINNKKLQNMTPYESTSKVALSV